MVRDMTESQSEDLNLNEKGEMTVIAQNNFNPHFPFLSEEEENAYLNQVQEVRHFGDELNEHNEAMYNRWLNEPEKNIRREYFGEDFVRNQYLKGHRERIEGARLDEKDNVLQHLRDYMKDKPLIYLSHIIQMSHKLIKEHNESTKHSNRSSKKT
jgi:hypothetical protein